MMGGSDSLDSGGVEGGGEGGGIHMRVREMAWVLPQSFFFTCAFVFCFLMSSASF